MKAQSTETEEQLKALGFSMNIYGPFPGVSEDGKEPWPHIGYTVKLSHGQREILQTPYSMGIGHIDLKKVRLPAGYSHAGEWSFLTPDEFAMLQQWIARPNANFKDKLAQASVAAKIALKQKVQPTLSDVLYSLLSDGEAAGQTFEEWAGGLGYDTDSRKAEATYRQCDEIGRKLAKVGAETLAKAREILQDY
jgi:hypothetical protein